MKINMNMFGISDSAHMLWNLENYPHAELYYELAYHALVDGDLHLAMAYFSKTVEALQNGNALTVVNGQKPLNEDYISRKRAELKIVQ
mgnify:CR=1 FL=1